MVTTLARVRSERWALPSLLTRSSVENWLRALPDEVGEVVFHVGAHGVRGGPGATESLQAAICMLHRRGVRTLLSFPPQTFAKGSRLTALADDTGEGSGTAAERTLGYRLPGLVLAQLCEPADVDSAADQVRRLQVSSLNDNKHMFGHGTSRAIAVIGVNDHRTHLRDSEPVRQQQLEDRMLELIGTRAYHPARGNPLLEEMLEFVHQATDNTFDHGRRHFDGTPVKQVRMATFSRHHVGAGAGAAALDRHFPDPTSHAREYVERARRRVAAEGKDPERLQLWTLSVADGGVGIAGQMHGDHGIYDAPLDREFALVQEAMLSRGTTKAIGELGRGRGLVKMMRATWRLGGLFEVRTGRLSLWRTYLDEHGGSPERLDVEAASSLGLRGGSEEQVAVAGTVVSVIFPALDLGPHSPGARSGA